jgi:hypothetical protein
MLVGLAAVDIVGASIVTLLGRGGWTVVLITYMGGGALMVVMLLRLRRGHYSIAAVAWFMFTILAFNLWNFLVLGASVWARWTGIGRWTFALVEVISAIPLIVGGWLMRSQLQNVRSDGTSAESAGSRG